MDVMRLYVIQGPFITATGQSGYSPLTKRMRDIRKRMVFCMTIITQDLDISFYLSVQFGFNEFKKYYFITHN